MIEYILERKDFQFFIAEKEDSKFIKYEAIILLLMLSCIIWISAYYFEFQGLFTFSAIQLIILLISGFIISREIERLRFSKEMIQLIYKVEDKRLKDFDFHIKTKTNENRDFNSRWRSRLINNLIEDLGSEELSPQNRKELLKMLKMLLYSTI